MFDLTCLHGKDTHGISDIVGWRADYIGKSFTSQLRNCYTWTGQSMSCRIIVILTICSDIIYG